MSARTSTVTPMRDVRNEDSLLFSVKDLAVSQPGQAADDGHGHEGSGLLDLEGLTRSYFEARNENAVLGLGAELPEAAVVAAWHSSGSSHLGIIGIAFAAITGVASSALILMAAWMWIVPHVVGAGPPARQAAAPASITRTPEPPRPSHTAPVAAASPDEPAKAADPAPAVPAEALTAPSTEQVVAAAPATPATQRPARPPASSRPRPRAERAENAASAATSPAGAAECLDEVACLLASDPPACCTRAPSSETGKPQASPREENTTLPDKLDRAAIQAGIGQVRERVAACERHGAGTVSLSVRVDGDGQVSAADVKSAPNQALGSCVAQAVEGARFARSRSGQRFTYPFVF